MRVKFPVVETLDFVGVSVTSGAVATCCIERVLTWRDGANTGEGDIHEGGGVEGRQKVGDEVESLESGFNGRDAGSSSVDGLGISLRRAQERANVVVRRNMVRVHCSCCLCGDPLHL